MENVGTLRRLGSVLLAAGLLMAGCSDADSEPAPTAGPPVTESPGGAPSSPEPTSSPTPAPGPTPWPEPTRPTAMERDDIEGAKAAAEYFLALYPYVYVTGDLLLWREMSHPECIFCASVIGNVEDMHSKGGFADGPGLQLLSVDAAPPRPDFEYFSVWLEVEETAHAYYDSSGSIVEEFERSEVELDMALSRVRDDWVIRGVTTRSTDEVESDA